MEYCDKASLRHAMKKGVFHKRLDNTSVAVDLCAIVQVTHAWGAHSCLGNALMPGEHTHAWGGHSCLGSTLMPGEHTHAWGAHAAWEQDDRG